MEIALVPPHTQDRSERESLVRRAKLLAWLGIGWHGQILRSLPTTPMKRPG